MEGNNYPVPHSHKTFDFGSTTIDSNFDSGNLYNAEKINNTQVFISTYSTTYGLLLIMSKISIGLGSIFPSRDFLKEHLSLLISKICKIRYITS